ncbi:nose resistant to fluoxetine protein 6-like [Diadema setosum]|uniref:nose resistant to fluoxetine protein 6-like n=1 Tax=Diadema setosum TaxID=31175 RepID=UPI003B3A58A8
MPSSAQLIAVVLWIALSPCHAQQELALGAIYAVLTDPSVGPVVIDQMVNDTKDPTQCLTDLQQYSTDLAIGATYARKMVTSFGDMPGVEVEFTWTAVEYGVIEQCLDVNKGDASGSPFDARYCMAMTEVGEDPDSMLQIQVGTCWPSSCSGEEVNVIADEMSIIVFNVTDPKLNFNCFAPEPWKADAIAVLTVFSLIAALVVIGTIYDLYLREHFMNDRSPTQTIPIDDRVQSSFTNGGTQNLAFTTACPTTPLQDTQAEKYRSFGDVDPPVQDPVVVETSLGTAWKSEPNENARSSEQLHAGGDSAGQDREGRSKTFETIDGILMAYSAASNLKFLLSAKRSKSDIGALYGLRTLSMFWVILLHCNLFLYGSQKIDNYYYAITNSLSFPMMAIRHSTLSVDTFFVIGGLLVTYVTLKKLTKTKGKMNWAMYVFHRYWRLTPALLGAMALWVSLGIHMAGQGPLLDFLYNQFIRDNCRETWWTYPLYINNLYPFPGDNNYSCFGWAWYLACDMQFYLLSPFIIVLLYRRPKLGVAAIVAVTAVSIGSMIGIKWYYGINPVGDKYNDRPIPDTDITYTKPYTRIHSYTVGMFVGYIMFYTRDRKVSMPWWIYLPGWIVAFALMFACVYGLYWALNPTDPDFVFEQYKAVLWEGLTRFTWSIAIGWICFACVNDCGGVVNTFLTWNFWIPMGRLTYCTYLIHPLVIYNVLLSGKALFHWGNLSWSYFYVGTLVFCYMAGLILSLLMEMPPMGLEKVMFKK